MIRNKDWVLVCLFSFQKRKMKSTMFFTCLMLISFLKLAISQECMTPTQVAGTCIDIKNCQPLLELLRREGAKAADFAKKFICRIEGKNPIVCCPGKSGGSTERNLYGPLLPPQCGFSNVFRPRIVGGMPAKLNALPWMAALGFKKTPTSELEWNCGGSLISARHVLTAAHCAERNDLVVVRLGDLDLKRDDDGAHPIDLRFEKKIIHSEYNKSMHINDVAILRLERDVQFTYNIHPICLPVGKIAERDFVNTRPFLAGWGTIYLNGPRSDVLREVQIPVVTTQT
ncbi:venom serine protease Bi-VSP-like [Ceratina calcarata]|uniref:CLIP domain-containing serine protease n=1 Tax=Ceratina calcarata TaxID=156304 RepID=A0AAJ7J9K6_9HYME|nr:venom serine protease Bi-VSP-like [Ceratina calcarata]